MGDDAAFHGGENGLEGAVLVDDLVLVGPFLSDIDGHAHGAHDRAVDIVEGRLVGGEQARSVAGLHHLLGDDGGLGFHNLALRFDARRVIGLHIPNIGVAATLHIVFGLVHRAAEGIVHFMVNAVGRLVPDKTGNGIDRGLQVLGRLPGIGVALAAALPMVVAIGEFRRRQRRDPNVGNAIEEGLQRLHLLVAGNDHHGGRRLLHRAQLFGPCGGIVLCHVHEQRIGPSRQGGIGDGGALVAMGERRQRSCALHNVGRLFAEADQAEVDRAMVHDRRPSQGTEQLRGTLR